MSPFKVDYLCTFIINISFSLAYCVRWSVFQQAGIAHSVCVSVVFVFILKGI